MEAFVIGGVEDEFMERNGRYMQGINARFVEAEDGARASLEYAPNDDAVLNFKGRGMTYGEMGCFKAHMKIWEEMQFWPPNARALIFEADAVLLDHPRRALAGPGYAEDPDVVYLAYKMIDDGVALWSCAYSLKGSAARFLTSSFSQLKSRAFPTDEFLALACTTSLRARYVHPKIAVPMQNSSRRSTTEKSFVIPRNAPRVIDDCRTYLVSVATDPNNQFVSLLKDTAILYNWHLCLLGSGVEWQGPGNGQKLPIVLEALRRLHPRDIVVFVDGYDVIMNAPLDSRAVERFQKGIVVASEVFCWPDADLQTAYPAGSAFLNSGCYAGSVELLTPFLEACLARLESDPERDDQRAMVATYLELGHPVSTDSEHEYFLCLNGTSQNTDYTIDRARGCVLHRNGNRPLAVHANGGWRVKASLWSLYTAQYWSPDVYGVAYRGPGLGPGGGRRDRTLVAFINEAPPWAPTVNRGKRTAVGVVGGSPPSASGFEGGSHAFASVEELGPWCAARNIATLVLADPKSTYEEVLGLIRHTGPSNLVCVPRRRVTDPEAPDEEGHALPCERLDAAQAVGVYVRDSRAAALPLNDSMVYSAVRLGILIKQIATSLPGIEDPLVLDPRHSMDMLPIQSVEVCPSVHAFPLLSREFCAWLVSKCESHNGWSSGTNHIDSRIAGSFENVPTRDVHLKDLGPSAEAAYRLVFAEALKIADVLYDGYQLKSTNLAFVVKYEAGTQAPKPRMLRPHHDASTLTLNVALNDGFRGGGTVFVRWGPVPRMEIGAAMMHPGRATHKHGALPVTSGTRYVLVCFLE